MIYMFYDLGLIYIKIKNSYLLLVKKFKNSLIINKKKFLNRLKFKNS